MLEFLPSWAKALIGSGLMIFIGIFGFAWTTHKDNKNKPTSNKETKGE
jgi:hypothetical protein